MSSDQVDDASTLKLAATEVHAAGLADYTPRTPAYPFAIGKFPPERLRLLPLCEIDPPLRDMGAPLFSRAKPILDAIKQGDALPPIEVELLPATRGHYRYRARDGFHRFHLSRALGFVEIPAIVWPYFE